jgi:hypothetical protein
MKRVVHVTVKFRAEIGDDGVGIPPFQVDTIVDAAAWAIPAAVAWLPGATVSVALDRKSATAARAIAKRKP